MPDDFPADTAPEIGSLIAGKYQVLRHIGAGGMGSVVEAENTATGKRVAVKCMLPYIAAMPGAVQLFTREARVCASVQHPNVVQVFDLVHDTSSVFIIMELLDGESLRAFFGRGRPCAHELIGMLLEAMRGVYAAHEQGVIHRDIKPENIFLAKQAHGPPRTVKVLDFGLSKPIKENTKVFRSKTGEPMGTPQYMSPEQLDGVHDIDARTDVYAFGVILYEGLAGEVPYPAETHLELAVQFARHDAAPLRMLRPEIPVALEAIVARAIAKDRAMRIPSLDVLITELEPFAAELQSGFRPRKPMSQEVARLHASVARPAPLVLVGPEVMALAPVRQIKPKELTPSSRESYPSIPSFISVSNDLDAWSTIKSALRGELSVWGAVEPIVSAVEECLTTGWSVLRRLLLVLVVSIAGALSTHKTSPSLLRRALVRPNDTKLSELFVRALWAFPTLFLSVVLFVGVVVCSAVRVVGLVLGSAFGFVSSFWSEDEDSDTERYGTSRQGKKVIVLLVVCIAIVIAVTTRLNRESAAPDSDSPEPNVLGPADPPEPEHPTADQVPAADDSASVVHARSLDL